MKRSASAVWKGGLQDGGGTFSSSSGVFSNISYNYKKRFEDEPGTNPEELVAAAHAACFSMALSLFLANNGGMKADSIETTCTITAEPVNGAFTITESHLETKVKIPNADKANFEKAAEGAKAGCPISRLLNTKITMNATLV
jgi:osmotically inducible protein OsmC